jgi:hypothetical protein
MPNIKIENENENEYMVNDGQTSMTAKKDW